MRTFKTICHNNIHRDYTDELIKMDPNIEPAILWRDNRPTFVGELRILSPTGPVGSFEVIDLVVGQEYELQDNDYRVYLLINGNPCLMIYGTDEVIGLGDGFVMDTLDYHDFFYSESEMRDRKLNELGINE